MKSDASLYGEEGPVLAGISGTLSIALGIAWVLKKPDFEGETGPSPEKNLGPGELAAALETSKEQLRGLIAALPAREGAIFSTHLNLLEDPAFTREPLERMEKTGCGAAEAIRQASEELQKSFQEFDDPYLRERAADIKDVGERILRNLRGEREEDLASLPPDTILVAADLTPSQAARLNPRQVRGIVTEGGGKTSHALLIAGAMNMAAVVGCKNILSAVKTGDLLFVDAPKGKVYVNPGRERIREGRGKMEKFAREEGRYQKLETVRLFKKEGGRILVGANIGSPAEAEFALQKGADGIGLFRTEFLFIDRKEMPGEEEQYLVYRRVAEIFAGKPVVIRTLDAGGDKPLPYLNMRREENPFLGLRAIRLCLAREPLFRIQLRALLRAAAAAGNIRIMFPMIASPWEFRAARDILESCKEELSRSGVPFLPNPKIGIMIEIPAAAILADEFAGEADFFSIGTNDLTQYTLAADRGNPEVSSYYDCKHPAVVALVKGIIEAARRRGIPCFMCGEMASDPEAIPLLSQYGIDEFSVSTDRILRTKEILLRQENVRAEGVL
ncbi:MAG: phosphoenolpyruvate--protein phosphotransferase [Treponema sp.]|nr:phosphoenolpyruvate--protein phosphotransferase [Treponema sp.]